MTESESDPRENPNPDLTLMKNSSYVSLSIFNVKKCRKLFQKFGIWLWSTDIKTSLLSKDFLGLLYPDPKLR